MSGVFSSLSLFPPQLLIFVFFFNPLRFPFHSFHFLENWEKHFPIPLLHEPCCFLDSRKGVEETNQILLNGLVSMFWTICFEEEEEG